jgi:hypothetical protein
VTSFALIAGWAVRLVHEVPGVDSLLLMWVGLVAEGLCHATVTGVTTLAIPRGPGTSRHEPQRGLNIKVAAVYVIKSEPDEHVDRAILLRVRLRCAGGHGVNLSRILTCFMLRVQAR